MTVSTFNPDADAESTSVDGNATRGVTNETFATIRAGAGTVSTDSLNSETICQVAAGNTTDRYNQFIRSFYFFDTSSIGDNDTIDSAIFGLVVQSLVSDLGGDADLVDAILASNTAVVDADYQGTVAATTLQATGVLISGVTADDSTYTEWTLNATGLSNVSKTSITKFGVRVSWDVDDDEAGITWASDESDSISGRFAEIGGAKMPRLVVTHTTPVSDYFASVIQSSMSLSQPLILPTGMRPT